MRRRRAPAVWIRGWRLLRPRMRPSSQRLWRRRSQGIFGWEFLWNFYGIAGIWWDLVASLEQLLFFGWEESFRLRKSYLGGVEAPSSIGNSWELTGNNMGFMNFMAIFLEISMGFLYGH